MFSEYAIKLLSRNILKTIIKSSDLESRELQMIGSFFAGVADNYAGVGLIHTLAYPLQEIYNISHSISVSLFLDFLLKTHYQEFIDEKTLTESVETVEIAMKYINWRDYLSETTLDVDLLTNYVIEKERLLVNHPRF